jgi:hypothetical protein
LTFVHPEVEEHILILINVVGSDVACNVFVFFDFTVCSILHILILHLIHGTQILICQVRCHVELEHGIGSIGAAEWHIDLDVLLFKYVIVAKPFAHAFCHDRS